jgi:hypothetical protein
MLTKTNQGRVVKIETLDCDTWDVTFQVDKDLYDWLETLRTGIKQFTEHPNLRNPFLFRTPKLRKYVPEYLK